VDRIVDLITEELGGSVTAVIATGGLAPVVIKESSTVTVHRPDLTLQGLRMVYDKNV
jgi:type III pantothenate kinase